MKPLSATFRRTLFFVMIGVFIVGTPVLIGYSTGYRFGNAFSLIKTGGIYVHSDMSGTSVYLDEVFIERSGTIFRNTFMQNLEPGQSYTVRVEKEGYQGWRKSLRVRPNLVTEARVIMIPEEFEWRVVAATTTLVSNEPQFGTTSVVNPLFTVLEERFAERDDQFVVPFASTTLVTVRGAEVATSSIYYEYQFPSWMEEFASSTRLSEKTMVRERGGVVTWIEDGNVFVAWARTQDPVPFYFCDKLCYNRLMIDWEEPILRYDFYPNRSDVVMLVTERGLYVVEIDNRSQRNIQVVLEEPNLDFRLGANSALTVFDGVQFRETRL